MATANFSYFIGHMLRKLFNILVLALSFYRGIQSYVINNGWSAGFYRLTLVFSAHRC